MTAADTTPKGTHGDPFSSPWRRRLPLLPGLIFAFAVTQLPSLVRLIVHHDGQDRRLVAKV